jgi:hypothetical protein
VFEYGGIVLGKKAEGDSKSWFCSKKSSCNGEDLINLDIDKSKTLHCLGIVGTSRVVNWC